jgi:TRAP transporter TAXI family solute receptor
LFDAVEVRITKRYQALPYAAAALERRQVDAVLWSGGVPTPALTELHARVRIRLLPIVQAMPALRDLYGTAYQQVSIPAGGYGRAGTPTIGVANLLVCRKDLPDDVAAAITRVLVDRAARLVPRDALGAQFLDRRTLIGLFGVPTHPGAAATYRQLHG